MFEFTSADDTMISVLMEVEIYYPSSQTKIKYKFRVDVKCIFELTVKRLTKGLLLKGPQSALGPEPQQT